MKININTDPKESKFYIGALIGFAASCLILALLLCWFWYFIKDYEECLPSNVMETVMESYHGGDLYYFENSAPGSEEKSYKIQDGNRMLAEVTLIPAGKKTLFGRQKYQVQEIREAERPEPMVEAEGETVWAKVQREAEEKAAQEENGEEEKERLPITEEEEQQVAEAAEAFIRAYSPFATVKNTGEYRAPVLALLKEDTELYDALKSYVNDWGQNISSYDFSDMEITEIIKTSEKDYECDASCVFSIRNADWGLSRPYDLSYHLNMTLEDGALKISAMQ